MFEVSKAEIIETLASFRNSNEFGRYEKGKVFLEDGSTYDIRASSYGWSVRDCITEVKAEDIELRVAIEMVLDQNYRESENLDSYEDFESGAMYYSQAN